MSVKLFDGVLIFSVYPYTCYGKSNYDMNLVIFLFNYFLFSTILFEISIIRSTHVLRLCLAN